MDTKLATNQIRIQQWAGVIKDRCESGLNVADYCETHQVSKNQYYYWLRKVKEAALTESGNSFIEIPYDDAETSCPAFVPQLTISVGQSIIGINESTPSCLLSKTLEVLKGAQ